VEKLEKSRADNVANLAWLTRTTVYLRDKAERLGGLGRTPTHFAWTSSSSSTESYPRVSA
jgi:hypothetical protein